ncbi:MULTISPECIES: hypothetical protein [Enterobacter]|nr:MULTISPECIES: hypothetical protein [Enterobacter]MDV5355014.1 hypothetical protein [Enterobacter asburiae]CAE6056434.1 hypothetical protein AH0328V1_4101 [Enterobacter cloacae]AGN86969.1 hypothetical protein H650_18200 [Enterobacter sp. R4-368]EUM43362.1 hypothetical protein L406_01263 [Enterobacter sp. BWH 37]EUM82843.1 hypothetical protein L353_05412 [Enterobacter sp. MGH 7]
MIWHNEQNDVRHDNMPDDDITDAHADRTDADNTASSNHLI